MEIALESIAVKSNPRTDFGPLDELAASIKEKGIIEPLVVKKLDDNAYELVAGERRLRAAKSVGLETVPVSIREGDEIDIEEVKLIENIHRKNFNPIEEAQAFQNYIDTTKASIQTLADKIAKPKLYVERRLELLNLPKDIQKAVSDSKIRMGHALVIARLNGVKAQREMLKDIIREKYSVGNAEYHLKNQDSAVELKGAQFEKSECKGCNYNGGEQSLLFGTGSEIKGICLNKKCFMKKTKAWVADQKKKLKNKGVNVMSEKAIEKLRIKNRVGTYDTDYKSVMKRLHKEPETFAVVFEKDWAGRINKRVWCINPKARHPKKKATPKQAEAEEKVKAQSRIDKLKGKISFFKRDFLITKTRELMKPSTKESKAMTLFALLEEGMKWTDKEKRNRTEKLIRTEKIGKSVYGMHEPVFSKILALDEPDIDRLIMTVSGYWVKHLHNELNRASEIFGVNLTEHFQITEEYLKPYTKNALVALASEIGLDKHLEEKGIEKWSKAKRADLQSYFLNEGFDLKGKVPKLMAKAT